MLLLLRAVQSEQLIRAVSLHGVAQLRAHRLQVVALLRRTASSHAAIRANQADAADQCATTARAGSSPPRSCMLAAVVCAAADTRLPSSTITVPSSRRASVGRTPARSRSSGGKDALGVQQPAHRLGHRSLCDSVEAC